MVRTRDAKRKREKILDAISQHWAEKGVGPTVREIGTRVGISSTSHVDYHLKRLIEEGKVIREQNKARSIFLVQPALLLPTPAQDAKKKQPRKFGQISKIISIPDFGNIAAGIPLILPDASFKAISNLDEEPPNSTVEIPESYLPAGVGLKDVFALHVEGDSMRDAMLTDGDIVILQRTSTANVKNGDIVAAWIIDTQETTLKRFERTERGIALRPENPNYNTLFLQPDEVDIQGRMLAVLRFR